MEKSNSAVERQMNDAQQALANLGLRAMKTKQTRSAQTRGGSKKRSDEYASFTATQSASLKFGRAITNRSDRASKTEARWSLPSQLHGTVKASAFLVQWPTNGRLNEAPFLKVKRVPELAGVEAYQVQSTIANPIIDYPFCDTPRKFRDKTIELFYFPEEKRLRDGTVRIRHMGGATTSQSSVDQTMLKLAFLGSGRGDQAIGGRVTSRDAQSAAKSLMSAADALAIFELMPVDFGKTTRRNVGHAVWIEFTSTNQRVAAAMSNAPNRVGCVLYQSVSVPAFESEGTREETEKMERVRIWSTPVLVVIPRRQMVEQPTIPTLIQRLDIPLNFKQLALHYYAFAPVDAYEFDWSSFQWNNAFLLGKGARGSVVRVVFTPNADGKITKSEGRLLSHYREKRVEHALPTEDVHVVVALKLTIYAPFHAIVEMRMEYSLAILVHTLPELVYRFNDETVTFDDYHLAPCYGYIVRRQFYGLVMKLFPYEFGESLAAIAILKHQLDPSSHAYVAMAHAIKAHQGKIFSHLEIVRILCHIFHALAFLHGNGYVHRDVKPANILMTSTFAGMLSDFGFMWPMGKYAVTSGTPIYQPPGFQEGTVIYEDGFVDIFSMGVIIDDVVRQVYKDFYEVVPEMESIRNLCATNGITAATAFYRTASILRRNGMSV